MGDNENRTGNLRDNDNKSWRIDGEDKNQRWELSGHVSDDWQPRQFSDSWSIGGEEEARGRSDHGPSPAGAWASK